MNDNLNNKIKNKIKEAILDSNWSKLSRLRETVGDPGYICYVENIDLSSRELGDMPTDFICFKNCILDNTSFVGKHYLPMSFWNCSAKNLDIRDSGGTIFAYNTDFINAKFNNNTKLNTSNSQPSIFMNCKISDDLSKYLKDSGVIDTFTEDNSIYAFGVKLEEL